MSIVKNEIKAEIARLEMLDLQLVDAKRECICPTVRAIYSNTIKDVSQRLAHVHAVDAKFKAGLFTRKDSLLAVNESFTNIAV